MNPMSLRRSYRVAAVVLTLVVALAATTVLAASATPPMPVSGLSPYPNGGNPNDPLAVTACNGVPFCYCRASISGGTRCGMAPPDGAITCGTCRSDGECIARYGHGAFCSDCCGGRGGCAVPCPG